MATQNKRETANKPQRVPVSGIRDIMTVHNKDPDYSYRWVNDRNEDGSRIARFKRGGYEFARQEDGGDKYMIGQEAVYKSEKNGSLIRLRVGPETHAYLMRIKKEWFDEDQAAKSKDIRSVEDQIRRTGTSTGEDFEQYGDVDIDSKRW